MITQQGFVTLLNRYLLVLVGLASVLGVLHVFYHDVHIADVYWFNVDAERNLATWFSGMMYLFFALAALVVYYWEHKQNHEHESIFSWPMGWCLVALFGLYLSLDEITILHENMYWLEMSEFSLTQGGIWQYVSQWQCVFAPLMLAWFTFLVVFLTRRFRASPKAMRYAVVAMTLWLLALVLEAMSEAFRQGDARWYPVETLLEESCEFFGAIALLAAILFYLIDIVFEYNRVQLRLCVDASQWFSKRIRVALLSVISFVSLGVISIYMTVQDLSYANAPTPNLLKRVQAIKEKAELAQITVLPARFESYDWFQLPESELSLTDDDAAAILKMLYARLTSPSDSKRQDFPDLRAYEQASIVFLTLSNGRQTGVAVMGFGPSLAAALEQVLIQAQSKLAKSDLLALKLDVVSRTAPFDLHNYQAGLHGLAFAKEKRFALLPEQVLVTHLFTPSAASPTHLQRLAQREIAQPDRLRLFETKAYYHDGQVFYPLYHGHRQSVELTKVNLHHRLHQSADYLKKQVRPNGKIISAYYPETDSHSHSTDLQQQAGSILAMLSIASTTGDKSLLLTAKKSLDYLVMHTKPCWPDRQAHLCLVDKGSVSLEGNAMTLMALSQYMSTTDDQQYQHIISKMANWIVATQNPQGAFTVLAQTHPAGDIIQPMTEQGEEVALLSLIRLAERQPQQKWLASAIKAANHLLSQRKDNHSSEQQVRDSWLVIALDELLTHHYDPQYVAAIRNITQSSRQRQQIHVPDKDWLSSAGLPPHSSITAIRSQAFASAYRTFRDFGYPREANYALTEWQRGVKFQLQTQYQPESSLYSRQPLRTIGGFRQNLAETDIDLVAMQSNILSLTSMLAVM